MASQQDDDNRYGPREIDAGPEATAPLLGHSDASESSWSLALWWSRYSALVFLFALVVLTNVNMSLLNATEPRLLKMAVCRDYYRKHDPSVIGPPPLSYVDETRCSLYEIAIPALVLRVKKVRLGVIPPILFAIPYGRLSDRHGRKPMLFLGILGQALAYFWTLVACYFHETFATRLVLLSPAFFVTGGGSPVMYAVVYSVVVDVVPEGARTTVFYLIGAAPFICEWVMVPIGALFAGKDLWLPFHFGSAIMILAVIVTLFMPETLGAEKPTSSIEIPETPAEDSPETRTLGQRIFAWARDGLKSAWSLVGIAWATRELRFSFLILFLLMFNLPSGALSLSYRLLRDPRSHRVILFLLSVDGRVALGVLLALALLSQGLQHRLSVRHLVLDVTVVRASSVVLCAAGLLMGLTALRWAVITGYLLTAVSWGLYQAMHGLLASYGDKAHIGQLYGTAVVVDSVARMVGAQTYSHLVSWAWTELWSLGIWRGGLPFILVSILNALMTFAAFSLPTQV